MANTPPEKEEEHEVTKLNQELAARLIEAALAHANSIGVPMTVAVVDEGRNLMAFVRMDGTNIASVEVAVRKAYTARTLDMRTSALGPLVAPGGLAYGLENVFQPSLVSLGGGVPITISGEVVGAIGAAGGMPEQDEAVAIAAIQALGLES